MNEAKRTPGPWQWRDSLTFLYEPYEHELEAFGEAWVGPKRYPHDKWVKVAEYKKIEAGDGADVIIFCSALPARFYRIKGKGFVISTGSNMAELTAQIAKEIARGMIAIETRQKARKA